jgi:hypothetical protein
MSTDRSSHQALRMADRIRMAGSALGLDRRIIWAFVVSRLLVLVAAVVAEAFIIRNPALTSGDGAPILRSLTSWDGWYYLGIVRDGYHADPVAGAYRDVAFLPLFPVVVRILSAPWPQFAGLVAVIVANVAALISLGLLRRLAEPYLGRRRASVAAALMAIYPFAWAYAMAYTESLFLALSIGAFLAAEHRRRPLAGVLLALATLCRFQGLVLVIPLAILMLRQDDRRLRPSLGWLLLGPVAAVAFLAVIGVITGSPTAFLDAQDAWGRSGVGGAPAQGTVAAQFSAYQAALLLTLCWSVYLLVFVRRDRIRLEYILIPVLYIAAEMASGSLEAVGRVTMLAFPYAWILAGRAGFVMRTYWPVVSAGLFTALAILAFGGYWVP